MGSCQELGDSYKYSHCVVVNLFIHVHMNKARTGQQSESFSWWLSIEVYIFLYIRTNWSGSAFAPFPSSYKSHSQKKRSTPLTGS